METEGSREGRMVGTHFIRGWVENRTGLDGCGKSRTHQD